VSKGRYVATKSELAKRCGISYFGLLKNWERTGRPPIHGNGKARYEVALFQKWINEWKSAHNFGTTVNGQKPTFEFNEREKALIEKKRIEIARDQLKLDVERGKYMLKSDVADLILRNVSGFVRELDKAFRHEMPPRLEGASAGEIAKLLGRKLDEQRGRLVKAFSENGTNGNGTADQQVVR
jgi:hypothetical protein